MMMRRNRAEWLRRHGPPDGRHPLSTPDSTNRTQVFRLVGHILRLCTSCRCANACAWIGVILYALSFKHMNRSQRMRAHGSGSSPQSPFGHGSHNPTFGRQSAVQRRAHRFQDYNHISRDDTLHLCLHNESHLDNGIPVNLMGSVGTEVNLHRLPPRIADLQGMDAFAWINIPLSQLTQRSV